jgi:hypothetical protein
VDYTGIIPNGIQDGIQLYPNPTDEYITIRMDREHSSASIKVINASGQTVLVKEMDRLSKTNLDISRLDPGVYLIQLRTDQVDRIVRFMKE